MLASASPRRRELLAAATLPFEVRPAEIEETLLPDEQPADFVRRLAEGKARAVWQAGELTLGADTVVTVDGDTLGKPRDRTDAARMLARLSGRWHDVLTGFCLFDGARAEVSCETTRVLFAPLEEEEITAYIASGEPLDKAGAYGIQGLASKFVRRIEGCYFNVVGLPVASVYEALRRRGAIG